MALERQTSALRGLQAETEALQAEARQAQTELQLRAEEIAALSEDLANTTRENQCVLVHLSTLLYG